MRVILGDTGYSFHESIKGKRVIATRLSKGLIDVRVAELNRVGANLDLSFWKADESISFTSEEYTVITPTSENYTDKNLGEGWEGWYEQAPVRKSKFR